MKRFPLAAFVGQGGSRGLDFRVKTLQFGGLGRMLLDIFRLLSFPGGLPFFHRLTPGIQLRLLGRELFGTRGLGSQGFIPPQLPLATFVGPKAICADWASAQSRCSSASRAACPSAASLFFAFPRRLAVLPVPDAGYPARPAGSPQAFRLSWFGKSRHVAGPQGELRGRPDRPATGPSGSP